ncbi:hypothetical protein H6800_01345 [Candidatus Nomurabacteria bacterium]|nr:hypothetical protein [Candidatus Nomurabacteria bacterium]
MVESKMSGLVFWPVLARGSELSVTAWARPAGSSMLPLTVSSRSRLLPSVTW